jgi:SAM-dependent methyltransferase
MIELSTLETIAREYFRDAYPRASEAEIRIKVDDWLDKPAQALWTAAYFLKNVGAIEGSDLLDIGCGCGIIASTFARLGARARGVELDPRLADIARRLSGAAGDAPGPSFLAYDGRTLPFPDTAFDAALCLSVFEHVDAPGRLLAEVSRVLRPGGRILFNLPNRLFPYEPHTRLWGIPWLPRGAADAWARLRGRIGIADQAIRFYTYFSFIGFLEELELPLRVVFPQPGTGVFKAPAKRLLRVLGVHPTALAPKLNLILEKDRGGRA